MCRKINNLFSAYSGRKLQLRQTVKFHTLKGRRSDFIFCSSNVTATGFLEMLMPTSLRFIVQRTSTALLLSFMVSCRHLTNYTLSSQATWWIESSLSTRRSRRSTRSPFLPRNAPQSETWWQTRSFLAIWINTKSRWASRSSWSTPIRQASALTSTRSTSGQSATTPIDNKTFEDLHTFTSTI